MLINRLTGYQPEDLFLPRQATYSCIWGHSLHSSITQKVQTDTMTKGEKRKKKKKAMYYLPPLFLCLKIKASGH